MGRGRPCHAATMSTAHLWLRGYWDCLSRGEVNRSYRRMQITPRRRVLPNCVPGVGCVACRRACRCLHQRPHVSNQSDPSGRGQKLSKVNSPAHGAGGAVRSPRGSVRQSSHRGQIVVRRVSSAEDAHTLKGQDATLHDHTIPKRGHSYVRPKCMKRTCHGSSATWHIDRSKEVQSAQPSVWISSAKSCRFAHDLPALWHI